MEREVKNRNAGAAEPPRWRHALGTIGGVFLGAVLLFAVWAKALDPGAFAQEIRDLRLDFLLPAGAMVFVALAIEAGLGSALLFGIRRLWVLLPTVALVAFFLFLTGRDYWLDSRGLLEAGAGCGCFGNLVQRTPAEAFWQDLFLLVPALALAFVARPGPDRPVPWNRLGASGLVTVAAVLFTWKSPDLPLDDLATRLKPGVEVSALCAGGGDDQVCLASLAPWLAEGRSVVVLTDLDNERFLAGIEDLNRYSLAEGSSPLRVLTTADSEARHEFFWLHGPAFELVEVPEQLLRPLYRTLPRSFIVEEGEVVATYSGLPPLPEAGTPVMASGREDR